MNNLLSQMIDLAKGMNRNAGVIAETAAAAISQHLKCQENEAQAIIGVIQGLQKEYPAPFASQPWDEATWTQVVGLIESRLPKPAAPAAGLFGAGTPGPAQVDTQTQPRANGQPSQSAGVDTTAVLRAKVGAVARVIKAGDPERFGEYSLHDRRLEGLGERAVGHFNRQLQSGSIPNLEELEGWVTEEMERELGTREARNSVNDEAARRGWSLALRAREGQPKTRTDRKGGVIGDAEQAAIYQMVAYQNMAVGQAFDLLEFAPRQAAPSGLFGR